MRHLPLILCLALAVPAPLLAQTEAEPEDEGPSLMERGAQIFLRGLMTEMEPALRNLQDKFADVEPAVRSFVEEMGPAVIGLLREVKDFSGYHAPEILPNGDIIMRRKAPEELDEPAPDMPEVGPQGEVEL